MHLYAKDEIIQEVHGFTPLLAQWEKSTHPAQIRLHQYLDWLSSQIKPLPDGVRNLFLHLEVGVEQPERLLHHYDLENYLTPLCIFVNRKRAQSRVRIAPTWV